ncbi:MAG TPA: SGNH/GDSL hydrolase family protein [Streptosporangiaceae bacterium]
MLGRIVSVSPRRRVVAAGVALLAGVAAIVAGPAVTAESKPRPPGWVATWGGSAMAPSALVSSVQTLDNQTVRNIIHTSAGGTELRIRVSNAFGDRAVTIAAATVARQAKGAEIDAGSLRGLRFHGDRAVRLARGASALSDPVRMTVPALSNLAVSLYLPAPTGPATYHQDAQQTNFLASGDRTAAAGSQGFDTTVGTWFFLDAVQVRTSAPGAIVALGDSITDGFASTVDANARWPNVLADRLVARYGRGAPAVIDEGISGNRVLSDSVCLGVDLLSRLNRDVFSQPGARTVVLLEGVNDLGFSQLPNADCSAPNTNVTPAQLIRAYQKVIHRAHAHGLRIYGGTILPAQGSSYWDAAAEQKRLVINDWIKNSHAFDGVVDFAAVMAAPDHPELLNPAYDSGDHLHPNDAGYAVMAAAVDRVLARQPSAWAR